MLRPITRILAFFSKWMAEVIRQPALMLSLVVGPFLVLLAFGEGVEIGGPRPRTLVVTPSGGGGALLPIEEELDEHVTVVGTTDNLDRARAELRRGQVDAVMVLPGDPLSYIDQGRQIPITVYTGDIDPVRLSYARAYLRDQAAELNERTIQKVVSQAQAEPGVREELERRFGGVSPGDIPPGVLAAPYRMQVEEGLSFVPTFTTFYAPAVLALLLQHLGITLGALSMTRLRLLRLTDLLRVAPVRTVEVVTGHYLSYGLLTVLAGGLLLAGLLTLLGVPVLGSWAVLVGVMLLLVLTALGIGFVVSILSSSEQQAAQIAMLILLSSLFFSGFAFSLDRITWPIKAISFALPATYAIETLQDVMLRGVFRSPEYLAVLGIAGVVLFAATILLLRREFELE
jgi:ABC-2 type transport system permease protein